MKLSHTSLEMLSLRITLRITRSILYVCVYIPIALDISLNCRLPSFRQLMLKLGHLGACSSPVA